MGISLESEDETRQGILSEGIISIEERSAKIFFFDFVGESIPLQLVETLSPQSSRILYYSWPSETIR
jgi:hypothetical protein